MADWADQIANDLQIPYTAYRDDHDHLVVEIDRSVIAAAFRKLKAETFREAAKVPRADCYVMANMAEAIEISV